jgi:polyisoprenoid-binding protein YceI
MGTILNNKYTNPRQLQRGFILLWIAFTLFSSASAQAKYSKAEGSKVTISGTSTFKDWEMTSSQITSEVDFQLDNMGNPTHLNSLTFSLEAKSLTSGNRGLDNNAHKALNIKAHPIISFRSVSTNIIRNKDSSYTISVKGMLTIAGVTKEKSLETICVKKSDGSLSCKGDTKLLMTDFGVEPPVFMIGVMKTGDEITISYKMNYKL